MSSQLVALIVADGVANAALLFLVSVGLTLVFGVMRILNVAHGSLYALGAYAAASLILALSARGLSPWLSFPALLVAAALVGAIVGGALEALLLRRVYGKEEALQLLATFAVFMILENLQRLIWGRQPYSVTEPVQLLGNVDIAGISYTVYQAVLLPVVALVTLIALRLFLRATLAGRVIVAVTEDREAAAFIGIDTRRVFFVTFVVGACLAALGGALAAPTTSINPGMGAACRCR